MPLKTRDIDAADEAALRSWWEIGRAATAERPGSPWPVGELSRAALSVDDPEQDTTLIGVFDGEDMVAANLLMLPRKENLHTCGSAPPTHA